MLSASSLKQDARRQSLQKLSSFTAAAASAGVKKSSVCLQTKFQLVRLCKNCYATYYSIDTVAMVTLYCNQSINQ